MAAKWESIELSAKFFTNVGETVLRKANAAIENAFINESGGQTRFPGMREFCPLAGMAPTYLFDWEGDLIAVSNSRVYRIDRQANATDVTGVPLSGGYRPIFDKTPNELVIAAGAEILRLGSNLTEILSENAPLATHVGYIDDFLIAIEVDSGRWFHCTAGNFRQWDPIDVFLANSKPDNINGLLITPYREIIVTGLDSIEQYERLPSGSSTPFFRRWTTGEGVLAPYTLLAADQGTWGVNKRFEFVRFTGQVSEPRSDDIGKTLQAVDNWTDAWSVEMLIVGQKFLLLQIPHATNPYGTAGITALYEYRQKKWHSLYGWSAESVPTRWPGWSYTEMWGRHFVGGNGKVLELVDGLHTNDGEVQRMLGRTAHLDAWGESRVNNVRARLKRGVGGYNDDEPPKFGLRCIRDNNQPTRTRYKSLGRAGDKNMTVEFGGMGCAHTWQFEWVCTDPVDVELVSLEALVERVGR